jgi:Raf kinase inhibitor-like YbhB/YbcL family protein
MPGTDESLQVAKTIELTSPAFLPDAAIPTPYTCQGQNISPALRWGEPPADTRSFVLIVDDPDAPGKPFTHWVLYDLPPDLRQLPESVPPNPILLMGGVHGKNDFDRYGYGGPCPPSGTHRYVFKLYALDTLLDLAPGVSKTEVIAAMKGHILAGAELVGRYGK